MPTTSSSAAHDVLDALRVAGVEWCFLHGADLLERGGLSDLDIAARGASSDQIDTFATELASRGLFPLITHEHDVSAAAMFIVTCDLRTSVQLDVTVDPEGRGAYGVRTGVGLDAAHVDERGIAVLGPTDSWLYEVRKRSAKRETARLVALLERPPDALTAMHARADELFAAAHARHVHALLAGAVAPSAGASRRHEAWRRTRRTLRPSGLLVSMPAGAMRDGVAETVRDRLARLVPHTSMATTPRGSVLARLPLPTHGRAARWRAGVVLGVGAPKLGASFRIDDVANADAASAALVSAASARAERQLRRWLARTTG